MSVSERLNFSQPACVFRLCLQHGKHPDDRRSGEGLFPLATAADDIYISDMMFAF